MLVVDFVDFDIQEKKRERKLNLNKVNFENLITQKLKSLSLAIS